LLIGRYGGHIGKLWFWGVGCTRSIPSQYKMKASKKLGAMMTHKYRGCIVVLLINKSVEPNKEQKVLTSGFDQGFAVNTSKRVFRGIW
jgi:hypothetical protein